MCAGDVPCTCTYPEDVKKLAPFFRSGSDNAPITTRPDAAPHTWIHLLKKIPTPYLLNPMTPRPRLKILPPTSSTSATALSAKAELPERHPAGRCPAPPPRPWRSSPSQAARVATSPAAAPPRPGAGHRAGLRACHPVDRYPVPPPRPGAHHRARLRA